MDVFSVNWNENLSTSPTPTDSGGPAASPNRKQNCSSAVFGLSTLALDVILKVLIFCQFEPEKIESLVPDMILEN